MTADVVCLLDVVNTLLDADRIVTDLREHLKRKFGDACAQRYWAIFDRLRKELGYVDDLGALQHWQRLAQAGARPQRLLWAGVPDPATPSQRVAFGTSGHRGSSFELSFNEWHVLAITQAICEYRQCQHITGPLFMGIDTHALSQPACASALAALTPEGISAHELASEAITAVLDHAPGNGAAIGGIKVIANSGWFAARPSGTEDIYKIYAESFSANEHLQRILKEAQPIVDGAITSP